MEQNPLRLGATSCLILGMVALRGPSTPYQLKKAVERSVGNFWSFPHSQFYDEPARLARAGLLAEERELDGRHRRTYTITDAGGAAVRAWLREPVSEVMETRDVAQLQLFYGELGEPADIAELAWAQVAAYRERLAVLEGIERHFAGGTGLAYRMAPLALGLRVYQAALEFWMEIAERPPWEEELGEATAAGQ
jgi:DNA-binding PadR family transcriptional regulator